MEKITIELPEWTVKRIVKFMRVWGIDLNSEQDIKKFALAYLDNIGKE